jgi:large subunit ribosomal protein L25
MAASSTPSSSGSATKLDVSTRDSKGSREARRLRRAGSVPGVLYGGDGGPVTFAVEARELRHALAAGSAVLDVSIDGAKPSPAVLKDIQRHPVRGDTVHVDFLRVRLDRPIHAVVPLELQGVDDAPGVKEGGILEQITRELNVEALPTAIPPAIGHEVAEMQIGDTLMLSAVRPPEGVTLLDDLEETVIATLTPPRLQAEVEAELEAETELVGEEEAAEAAAEGAAAEAEGGAEGASEE